MKKFFDLSHPIVQASPCTFRTADAVPKVCYTEGESHGVFFITSRIDNLYSNICTHVDFPGHLTDFANRFYDSIGAYPVDRFIGPTAVLDFSTKFVSIEKYFDRNGTFLLDPDAKEEMSDFLERLDSLEITKEELASALEHLGTMQDPLKGIVIYSGLSRFWRYSASESWNYAYFFSPFLSDDACNLIVDRHISFVGIDALQIEHPLINYAGDELPVVLHQEVRSYISDKLSSMQAPMNHRKLLGHDILIYENLNIPRELAGCMIEFSGVPLNFKIPGLNDNGLVRPYAFLAN